MSQLPQAILQLALLLVGALLATGGGYLSARWQGAQQRASNLHQAQLALYVDLLAECRWRRDWLDRIAGLYDPGPYEKKIAFYRPSVPVGARLDLLGTPAMRRAWARLEEAELALEWDLNNDGFDGGSGGGAPEDYPGRLRMLAAVDALDAAVREGLKGTPATPARRGGVFRVLRRRHDPDSR